MDVDTYIWDGSDLGHALRERRRSLGIRQADAAAALGFSSRLLSEIENGRDTVGYGKVLKYAGFLAMDLILRKRS